MQTATPIDARGSYRSPSGERSFYPTSVFKLADTTDQREQSRSPSPPQSSSLDAGNRVRTPLLHRYRVSALTAQPRSGRRRSESVPAAVVDEPRTAPRLLTRSTQPSQRSASSPSLFKEEKAAMERSKSPPVMPRARSLRQRDEVSPTAQNPQRTNANAPEEASEEEKEEQTNRPKRQPDAVPHVATSAPRSLSGTHPLSPPCDDTSCIHSRESIVEFIQMQRELRHCYAAVDQRERELVDLHEALSNERLARQARQAEAVAECASLDAQCQEAYAQREAELEARWQERLDAAAREAVEAAALAAAQDAEIERLRDALARQENDSAHTRAAQQKVIQNLQQTVREYDAEVVRLEEKVAQVEAKLSAALREKTRLAQQTQSLEDTNRALRMTSSSLSLSSPSDVSPVVRDVERSQEGGGPATATTTPSKRFGRFRVFTPDVSPGDNQHVAATSSPSSAAPSPAVPPQYVVHGGQGRSTGRPSSPPPPQRSVHVAQTPPRPPAVLRHDDEGTWQRAAREADDRCKELLRALLDKESQIAKMGAERTRFKRLYEQTQQKQ